MNFLSFIIFLSPNFLCLSPRLLYLIFCACFTSTLAHFDMRITSRNPPYDIFVSKHDGNGSLTFSQVLGLLTFLAVNIFYQLLPLVSQSCLYER
jgi:hypothetical protein